MLIFLASMSVAITSIPIIQDHKHGMGPVPTRLEQTGGAVCPAGEFQVAAAWSKGRVSVTSLSFNGKKLRPAGIKNLRNSLSSFYGLRSVEVGCFSDDTFTVSIAGDKVGISNARITFLSRDNNIRMVP